MEVTVILMFLQATVQIHVCCYYVMHYTF